MAEKPSSPASDLAELVSCSICLESFKDARALPCLHSYCKECLQDLVTPQGKITCPHCRKEVDVPNGDVSNLNPNFIVNNVVDALNSIGNIPHTPPTIDATPTVLRNETTSTTCCKDHPEKECELFCQNCSKLICYKCISNWGTCGQHLYESIHTVVKEYRKNVEDFLKKREELLPSVIRHVEVLTKMKATQSECVTDVTKQISDTFAKHVEGLKKREETLIKQAIDTHLKNDDGLSYEVDRVKLKQAKIQNTIDFCHKILDHDDPALFLQEYTQVKDEVSQEDSQELVSHIDIDALCFQATDSLLTDVISNFGNVAVYDEGCAAEEKPAGAERPPWKPKRLPTSDRLHVGNKLRPTNELRPANDPFLANNPFPANDPFLSQYPNRRSNRHLVQRAHSELGAEASAKPVTWKFHNKNVPSHDITFEDNGLSVKTVSPKNVAVIGKPGFQRGKHSWKIKVTGYPDGLSIGICVGQNGSGIVVTYDKGLNAYLSSTINVLVQLDCDAKKVSVLPEGYQAPDVLGFENPRNYEVHPYLYLPPPRKYNSHNKITVLSIDGVTLEKNEECCIL